VLLATSVACSGGGSSSASSTANPSGVARTARLSVVIPAATAQPASAFASLRRRPDYVSPATQTIVVTALYGAAPPGAGEPVDVSPGSPNCTPSSGGTRTCNVSVAVLSGATALDVAARDAGNALLSHALVNIGGITGLIIDITVTLGGDARSTVLTLVDGEFEPGLISTRTLDVTALDADGNTIVLPGAFDVPVLLTASDGSISISPQMLFDPGDTATLTYNGNPTADTVVTASVGGTISTTGVVRVVGSGPPATPVPPPSQLPTSSPTPQPVGTPIVGPSPSPTPATGIGIIIINGKPER
jgi:hypothetical protein